MYFCVFRNTTSDKEGFACEDKNTKLQYVYTETYQKTMTTVRGGSLGVNYLNLKIIYLTVKMATKLLQLETMCAVRNNTVEQF